MKAKPAPIPAPEPSELEIQKLAYHLWIEGGRLEGVELENWFAAREQLRHQHAQHHAHAGRSAVRGEHHPARAGN